MEFRTWEIIYLSSVLVLILARTQWRAGNPGSRWTPLKRPPGKGFRRNIYYRTGHLNDAAAVIKIFAAARVEKAIALRIKLHVLKNDDAHITEWEALTLKAEHRLLRTIPVASIVGWAQTACARKRAIRQHSNGWVFWVCSENSRGFVIGLEEWVTHLYDRLTLIRPLIVQIAGHELVHCAQEVAEESTHDGGPLSREWVGISFFQWIRAEKQAYKLCPLAFWGPVFCGFLVICPPFISIIGRYLRWWGP